ncbi:MAG: hypothetical protein VX475_16675 [Myxococcota bacterium]|nr:hypothetical protein [Myxococcota bacterium]
MSKRWCPHAASALALTLTFFAMPERAHAGAWTQAEGDYYAKFWALSLVGGAGFDLEGETFETEAYRNFSLNYYAEYGLIEKWTILTHGRPVGYANYGGNTTPYVDDLNAGVRRGFLNGPVRLGIEGTFGYRGIAPGRDLALAGEDWSYLPAVSSGTAKIEGQLGIGIPNGWIAVNAGLKGYTNPDISDAFVGLVQVGYTIRSKVTLDLHIPINLQLGDEPFETLNIAGTGETDYVGAGLGVSWWMRPDFAINAAFDGVAFATANSATPAVMVGVEMR